MKCIKGEWKILVELGYGIIKVILKMAEFGI